MYQKIEQYTLFYTPGGAGVVRFQLAGVPAMQQTNPLQPAVFGALAAVLAQKNISFDPGTGTFASMNEDSAGAL